MATISEKNFLAEHILYPIGVKHARLEQKEVTGFLAMTGKNYQHDLMIVGRAVNGWTDGILPQYLSVPAQDNAYANDVFHSVTRKDGKCPMEWVTDSWGPSNNPDDYNTRKSSFWRVTNRVTQKLSVKGRTSNQWSSCLVWSNLYKVAPAKGGNPNAALRRAQEPGCLELLRLELTNYTPERLLFLTGMNWAEPFLDFLGVHVNETNYKYVQGFGKGKLSTGHQFCFVVASHPQGKKETVWSDEVVDAFNHC